MMEMATKTCRDKHLYDMKKINHGHVTFFCGNMLHYFHITNDYPKHQKNKKNPRASHVTSMTLTTVKRTVVCKKNLFKRNASNEFEDNCGVNLVELQPKRKLVTI